MVTVFERAQPAGWTYPCTQAELDERLSALPPEYLQGLWAVGLVPAARKQRPHIYGRYLPGAKPAIHLYSHPRRAQFRTTAHHPPEAVRSGLEVELSFGMRLDREGNRLHCIWEPEDLRRFVLEFVLLHEIGHHVCHWERRQNGMTWCPGNRACEQFAEDFAMRHLRSGHRGGPL